jgi:hypothetical protein
MNNLLPLGVGLDVRELGEDFLVNGDFVNQ